MAPFVAADSLAVTHFLRVDGSVEQVVGDLSGVQLLRLWSPRSWTRQWTEILAPLDGQQSFRGDVPDDATSRTHHGISPDLADADLFLSVSERPESANHVFSPQRMNRVPTNRKAPMLAPTSVGPCSDGRKRHSRE
jgi:hypothetical protein